MSDDDLKLARTAAWRAMQTIKRAQTQNGKRGVIEKVREIDASAETSSLPVPTDMKVKVITLLSRIGRLDHTQIDRILGFKNGQAKKLEAEHAAEANLHHERHIDNCVSEFYRSKITLLEHLIHAAPRTIAYWRDMMDEPAAKEDKRVAAKEIREWTALFLKTKQSSAVRDLLSEDLKEAADEADAMDEMLQEMLGQALSGEDN